jgi:hypothetical protein
LNPPPTIEHEHVEDFAAIYHTFKKSEGRDVSIVHVPVNDGWTPQEIRDKLLEKLVL